MGEDSSAHEVYQVYRVGRSVSLGDDHGHVIPFELLFGGRLGAIPFFRISLSCGRNSQAFRERPQACDSQAQRRRSQAEYRGQCPQARRQRAQADGDGERPETCGRRAEGGRPQACRGGDRGAQGRDTPSGRSRTQG